MFSIQNYKKLISTVKERGYHLQPLSEFNGKIEMPTILLRFDVDYCPGMAVEIAKINAEIDVSGTFFFLMESPLYNLLSEKTQMALQQLLTLKQEIGWHALFVKGKTTKGSLIRNWKIFKKTVPMAVPLVAWHNPQNDLLDKANAVVKTTGILKSVYAKPFISDKVKYLSDSNRRNGFNDLIKKLHVENFPQVQLLLHPLNWVVGGDDMKRILNGAWDALLKEMNEEFSVNPNW